MKFFVALLLTAVISFAACLYLPWWMVAIAGFLIAVVVAQSTVKSFLSGFLGVFILWFCLCFWMSSANNDLFAHKISVLVIKKDSPIAIILVSALIGGLVAGFGGMTGSFVRGSNKQ